MFRISSGRNPTSTTGASTRNSQLSSQRLLRHGSRGGDVRFMQGQLKQAGFNIKADGIFGAKTQSAVRAFQRSQGLKVDGLVGPQTQSALRRFTPAGVGGNGGQNGGARPVGGQGNATGVQRTGPLSASDRQLAGKIDNALGGALRGHGADFVAAGRKYGVDPKMLAAISMHETGNGTSRFARELNNVGGIMDPKTNWSRGKRFSSKQQGIDYMARNLKRGYLDKGLRTLPQIQKKYAPVGAANDSRGLNRHWIGGVQRYLRQIGN